MPTYFNRSPRPISVETSSEVPKQFEMTVNGQKQLCGESNGILDLITSAVKAAENAVLAAQNAAYAARATMWITLAGFLIMTIIRLQKCSSMV